MRDGRLVKDCVRVPPLDGLTEGDAERVFVPIDDAVVVPDALDVFDGLCVADCKLLPVDVFDDVIDDVPVNVLIIVTVGFGDEDTLVEAVPVFDARPLLDTVEELVEVFDGLAENDMVGLEVVVFDAGIEEVVVRLSFIVRVVVVDAVPVRVGLVVIEFVLDPVIVLDDVDVLVDVLLIWAVKEGLNEKEGTLVGPGE